MRRELFPHLLYIAVFAVVCVIFISCGSDDEEDSGSGTSVVIKDDGTTSNGSIFSAIDDKNFFLDYVKYTVQEGHLIVSGYDKVGFKGVAKLVSRITYKGNTYEVLEIGEDVFHNCKDLTSIYIPNSITKIQNMAFWNSGLSNVTIPDGVTTIGYRAFQDCKDLTSVVFGKNLESIGSSAFAGCTALTSVKVGDDVTYVGADAFWNTPWYDALPDGLVYIGHVAYKYKGSVTESSIEIKEGTTSITEGAFSTICGITSVNIPNSLSSISDYSFYKCSDLISVTIGTGVTYIGEGAFWGCPLSTIKCNTVIPPRLTYEDGYPFGYSVYLNATLYVPQGSLNAYKTSAGWSNFNNIVEYQ